jgi:hypothetical protein
MLGIPLMTGTDGVIGSIDPDTGTPICIQRRGDQWTWQPAAAVVVIGHTDCCGTLANTVCRSITFHTDPQHAQSHSTTIPNSTASSSTRTTQSPSPTAHSDPCSPVDQPTPPYPGQPMTSELTNRAQPNGNVGAAAWNTPRRTSSAAASILRSGYASDAPAGCAGARPLVTTNNAKSWPGDYAVFSKPRGTMSSPAVGTGGWHRRLAPAVGTNADTSAHYCNESTDTCRNARRTQHPNDRGAPIGWGTATTHDRCSS